MATTKRLTIGEDPALVYRQLYLDLLVFAGHSGEEDANHAFRDALVAREKDLCELPLCFWTRYPPDASNRQLLQQTNQIALPKQKQLEVSPLIQQEIFRLSDELQLGEVESIKFWLLASQQELREQVARQDAAANAASSASAASLSVNQTLQPAEWRNLSLSIPQAARYFVVSEMEFKLLLVKELMRFRYDARMDPKQQRFVVQWTNRLLCNGMLSHLLKALEEELPKIENNVHLQQQAMNWTCLVAESIQHVVFSTQLIPQEIRQIAHALRDCCKRLQQFLPKISPNIVNLETPSQLQTAANSLGAGSLETCIAQAACLLQTITALQVALISVLIQCQEQRLERTTGEIVSQNSPLNAAEHAGIVNELHDLFVRQKWDHSGFQAVAMLAWAVFLRNSGDRATSAAFFSVAQECEEVVEKAIRMNVYSFLVDVELKFSPDPKRNRQLACLYATQYQQLFVEFCSSLLVRVPTFADKQVMLKMREEKESNGISDDVGVWDGDCLENLIDFAVVLCKRNPSFARTFWIEDTDQHHAKSCVPFLANCRDAAFKNPACFSVYMRLVAVAAKGPDCAQAAFNHVKQNPPLLNWNYFFVVMNKYQRLLMEVEKPHQFSSMTTSKGDRPAVSRSIRPKELEALETIQVVIQSVICDPHLALIFFHNHEWAPIPTFVSLLQCRIPSSLKGEIMNTLAIFAQVPEIAPFVWRHVEALQILRTSGEPGIGNQDIRFELEHFESMARSYPATRGFLHLLHEYFRNHSTWSIGSDGRLPTSQYYFEFLVQNVFMKFDLRKYGDEDEMWSILSSTLGIFREILGKYRPSTMLGSQEESRLVSQGDFTSKPQQEVESLWFANLGYQLMEKLLSSSALLEKLLVVLTLDGGVDSLENIVEDLQFDRAFTFCRDYVREKTEGPLNRSSEEISLLMSQTSESSAMTYGSRAAERERSVVLAMEILLLVCEKDTEFVAKCRSQSAGQRLQLEPLYAILLRRRSDLVNVVRYIKYTKSVRVAKLSAAVFGLLSARVASEEMLYAVMDSGASAEIVSGYMCWLFKSDQDDNDSDSGNSSTDVDNTVLRSPTREPENEFDTISLVSRKRKRRSFTDLEAVQTSSCSVRSLILDLLLANLAKPAPNLAHLLLGMLDSTEDNMSVAPKLPDVSITRNATQTCLDAILILLSNLDFQLEFADLAERCHRVVYLLLSQEFTSRRVLMLLQHPKCDYFVEQLEFLLFRLDQGGGDTSQSGTFIAGLNTVGWLLKSTALYLHLGLARKDMEVMKRISALATSLVTVDHNSNEFVLLRLLDDLSFDFGPPEVPNDKTAIAIAEKLTSVVDVGVFSWLKIDVEAFYQALQSSMNGDGGYMNKRDRELEFSSESTHEQLLTWAIQWNCFSERVAALSHALNSWRQVVEVLVLRFFSLSQDDEDNDPQLASVVPLLPPVEQRYDAAFLVLEATLSKIVQSTTTSSISAQLVEIISTLCHALFAWLRDWNVNVDVQSESRRAPTLRLLELLFAAIATSSASFGNPTASRNSRTLLYSCLVNFCFSSRDAAQVMDGSLMSGSSLIHKFASSLSAQRKTGLVNERCVEVICRDASDACDSLSMALAISALESLVAFDGEAVVRMMRDQGFLLHFMSVFRKIASSHGIVETSSKPSGIANASTLYERLLSLFAAVALNSNGALALVENGLLAHLMDGSHVPSHRPRFAMAKQSNSVQHESHLKSENAFYQKWLPVLRLLSALCSALPQNGMLATKLLELIAVHRKLFSSALKEAAYQGEIPTLSLMRELTYTTSLFRYVGQFPELCDKMLTPAKMEKFSHWLVQVAFVYGGEVVPSLAQDGKDNASMKPGATNWWNEVVAHTPHEVRQDMVSRLCVMESGTSVAENRAVESTLKALSSLSIFGEEKLYASRMILCNSLACCSRRLMGVVENGPCGVPLFSISGMSWSQLGLSMELPNFASSRTSSLSVQPMASPSSPPVEGLVSMFEFLVQELQVARGVLQQFEAIVQDDADATNDHASGSDSQETFGATRNVLEYHLDSLTFAVETMMMLLTEHVLLYERVEKTRPHTINAVEEIVSVVDAIEDLPFVHALARKLREVELMQSS